MQRLRVLIPAAAVTCGAALLAATPPAQPPAPAAAPAPAAGAPIVPPSVKALMPGETALRPYDLKALVGRRPIAVCYFLLGESSGEEAFLKLQEAAAGLKGKAEVLGATRLTGKVGLADAVQRLSMLGVTLPVVIEEEPLPLASLLKVTTAPSLSLLDRAGVLRLSDARSLKQPVAEGMTVGDALRRLAEGGTIPSVDRLPRYYPATELIGERFPEFLLKSYAGGERIRLSDYVGREGTGLQGKKHRRILAVFFWHPDCKHCKQAMPGVVAGWNTYHEYIDLVGITDLKNADERRNADDTIRAHKMTFPILLDEEHRVKDLCKVISTPTIFFVKPDGVVESVYTRGDINYLPVFSAKINAILRIPSGLRGQTAKEDSR